MGFKKNTPGCCGCGATPPSNCATPLVVTVSDYCNGFSNPLPGASITVTRRSTGLVVATGTTGSDGKWQVFLPPVTGFDYEVAVTYRGYGPIGANVSSLEGAVVNASGQPIRVRVGCGGKPFFSMPSLRFGATAVGCGNVVMPGVNVRVFQRYADASPALLLGQGTTDSTGTVIIDLDSPVTDLDRLLGVADSSDFYQAIIGFAKGPGNNPNRCSFGFNVAQQSGQAFMYPDVPGLDTSERHTSSGWNARDYQQCCFPQSGMANRYRPYPATLQATIGPYQCTLTSTGSVWVGSFSATVPGARKLPSGGYNCVSDPLYATAVSTCVEVSCSCDGLAMASYCCRVGAGLPVEVSCEEARAIMASNPRAFDLNDWGGYLTSRSGDPFVMEGESGLGHWVVTE